MRAVLTRVRWARVSVAGEVVGAIDSGICALVGVGQGDSERDAIWVADKICGCRFFRDGADKMNHSLLDVHGAVLLISQFTLFGDLRRGNRPSFSGALAPELAEPLFERVRAQIQQHGIAVQSGRFGANMAVESLNDGPVTLLLDSTKSF
jgi:D-tyrosyl-tRNA(Tyr) deacylase